MQEVVSPLLTRPDTPPELTVLHAEGRYRDALAWVEARLDDAPWTREGAWLGAFRCGLLRVLGQRAVAREAAEDLVLEAEARGDELLRGEALRNLGLSLYVDGEDDRAVHVLERALEVFVGAEEVLGQAQCLRARADVLNRLGDTIGALDGLERAAEHFRSLARLGEQASTLVTAADVHLSAGRFYAAEPLLRQAVVLAERSRRPFVLAHTYQILARFFHFQGREESAAKRAARCQEIWDTLGYADGRTIVRLLRGDIAKARGDRKGARVFYEEAQAIGASGEHARLISLNLAVLAVDDGRWADVELHVRPVRIQGRGQLYACACIIDLARACGRGMLVDARRMEVAVRRALAESPAHDPDLARVLEGSALAAMTRGDRAWRGVAVRCLALAFEQWKTLGRAEDRQRVGAQLRLLADGGVPVPFGDLDLIDQIGVGSMGEVWRARPVLGGPPLAVKVLTHDAAQRSSAPGALACEVRSVARLTHPNLVCIHDHGRVNAATEAMTKGRLMAGTLYLVMDLVEGGSLRRWCGALPWSDCRVVLSRLLRGLAHAHARGVVHRDLKPDNVLVVRSGTRIVDVRLTDFGVAHAVGEEEEVLVVGTPAFMAPEQVSADVSLVGPWTDLYALGGLGWALVTGRPPFSGSDVEALMRQQVTAPLPALRPVVRVPQGFERWLGALLAKAPEHRVQRAADALAALEALADPPRSTVAPPGDLDDGLSEWATLTVFHPRVPLSEQETVIRPTMTGLGSTATSQPRLPFPVPEIPMSWRTWSGKVGSTPRAGLGLEAVVMREAPFLGRDDACDRLWALLRSRATTLVGVEGAAGVGKSRMIRWLAREAHASGAAVVIEVGGDGLIAALEKALGWDRLALPELWQAVDAALPEAEPIERVAVMELFRPGSGRVHLAGRRERASLLVGLLSSLRQGRVVVLCRPEGPVDALMADIVTLAGDRDLALLVLAEGALPEGEGETLQLGPLNSGDVRELIGSLLRLDARLLERVVRWSGGNPGLAVQQVASWVQAGQLVRDAGGFRLREGAAAVFPADLAEAWQARMRALLEELETTDVVALELLACAGRPVTPEIWREACRHARVRLRDELMVRAQRGGFVRELDGLWCLGHGLVEESLRIHSGSSWPDRHRSWVQVLRGGEVPEEWLGRHLLGAGDGAAAVAPLVSSAKAAVRQGEAVVALQLFEAAAEALSVMGGSSSDPRFADVHLGRCAALSELGRLDAAQREAAMVITRARSEGWSGPLGEALRRHGLVLRQRGELAQAERELREAAELLSDRPAQRCLCLHGLALAVRSRGRVREARELLQRAWSEAEEHGLAEDQGALLVALGGVAIQLGEFREARGHLNEALAVAEAAGSRVDVAMAHNALAEVARKEGRLEDAEAGYGRALQYFLAVGMTQAVFPRMNLGLVHLERRSWKQARSAMREVLAEVERQGRLGLAGAAHASLLAPSLALDDSAAFDRHLAEAELRFAQTAFAEPDVVWACRLAADVADKLLDHGRAAGARALADQQERSLAGRTEE